LFLVSVIHPGADSYVTAATHSPGSSAVQRYKIKNANYALKIEANATFTALILETFGHLGNKFYQFLSDLMKTNLDRQRHDPSSFNLEGKPFALDVRVVPQFLKRAAALAAQQHKMLRN
jgi:hypothetical protein